MTHLNKFLIVSLIFCFIGIFSSCGVIYLEDTRGTGVAYQNEEGKLILNCNRHAMYDEEIYEFWKENNLPKGTAEFVCKDGKAYLPNQVPSGQ